MLPSLQDARARAAQALHALQVGAAFDDAADYRREIEGIVNGNVAEDMCFSARTGEWSLPIPLLHDHCWETPCGVVTHLRQVSAGLQFRGRVADRGPAANIWPALKSGDISAASIRGVRRYTCASAWDLVEISACDRGADSDAKIYRVMETARPGATFIDRRPREIVHRDLRALYKSMDLQPLGTRPPVSLCMEDRL